MGIIATILSGPLLGLLGSAFSSVMGYFEREQRMKADKAKHDHETRLLEMNIRARGQEMENEAWIAQMGATADMLAGSYEHDASYGPVSGNISAALRFVRPLLTLILVVLTGIIYFSVADGAVIEIDGDTMTVRERVVISVLLMTEAAITWWFADRRISRKGG